MVNEFLEKIRDGLLEEQLSLKEKEIDLQNHFKENMKLIQLLEETNDPNYASFTPREVNGYNKKKIDELSKEQKAIEDELTELRVKISDNTCQLNETNSVIKVAKSFVNHTDLSSGEDRFSILATQERERQRIARDLHDSTVQNLTSLVHKSELCMKLLEVDPIRCKLELSSLSKILHEVIDDTRNMIYDLRPMSFDDIGFDVTVDRYLDKLRSSTSASFSYKVNGDVYSLNSVTELTLLRVIQEACANAIRHGEASRVDIVFTYYPEYVQLNIDDDGKGIDLSSIPDVSREDNSGFGLSIMKERIYLLSGDIQFESQPDKGFHITIKVPKA
ncbi:MAG: histidine kinase [Agathobacter sp.]|nr:histidine kinase [Agathobacter sp.]